MAQGILSRNPCANFHNRFFVTISDDQTCTLASVVGIASSAGSICRNASIPVAGGKFRACLTIVQMR